MILALNKGCCANLFCQSTVTVELELCFYEGGGWHVYYHVPLCAPIHNFCSSAQITSAMNSDSSFWNKVFYYVALHDVCTLYKAVVFPTCKVVWYCEEIIMILNKQGELSLFTQHLYNFDSCCRIFVLKLCDRIMQFCFCVEWTTFKSA